MGVRPNEIIVPKFVPPDKIYGIFNTFAVVSLNIVMNLVIDQGNTRTKYAYYQNGVIVSHGVLLNEVIRDFNPLLNGQAPDKAIICSVKNDDELKLVVMPVCKETIVFNSGTRNNFV